MTVEFDSLPRPGTDEARKQGCKCPVLDNNHGKGRYGDGEKHGWFISGACEMHWTASKL